jgi:UMF1 family MFS transporter
MVKNSGLKKAGLVLVWALYDLANQFFAVNIISLYFVRWLTLEKKTPEIFYSIAFGASMFLIAVSAPILGAISDARNRRMPYLIRLTLLSVVFTMALGLSENIFVALLFFAIANFGCQTAVIFYNALIVDIAPAGKIGLVSGVGRMLGYSGALLALYLIKPIVLRGGYRATFLPTGILFLLFSLPCMIFIKDKISTEKARFDVSSRSKRQKTFEVFGLLKGLIFSSDRFFTLANFMKSAFFGLCAVSVVILFMSVYATRVFKLNEPQIINLVAFSTIFAIAGSIISGYISDRIGPKISLIATFILWAISITLGAFAADSSFYWLVGALVGITLGATWVLWRAMAVRLVSEERIGEMFGLFNLVGYLSSMAGALFWGLVTLLLSSMGESGMRLALFSLNLFIALGLIFLLRIPKIKTLRAG